jgi:uncharacterized protein (TIGR03083 family)
MEADARRWIAELRRSHDGLTELTSNQGATELTGPSYCKDWNIAQVLSHLGSGAEIAMTMLDAALDGTELPEREAFQKVWDRWNALDPEAMAAGCIQWNEQHVARLEALDDQRLSELQVPFFGRTMDAAGVVGMRLGEHVMHAWDVRVMTEPETSLPDGASELLIDQRAESMGRMARGPKPERVPSSLAVSTSTPRRNWILGITEEDVTLASSEGGPTDGELQLPAEALLRLSFGRLDPQHSPADVAISGPVSLDELRALFPGF